MNEVLDAARAWRAGGHSAAVGTVVRVKMSAPRPPGAKMAVSSEGELVGAVSGGCVEGSVVQVAEEVMRGAPPRLLHFGIADEDAWNVGISAPIGLDLGALTPDETAVSIMAEVVAVRHGRSGGGRLREARGRIHEVAA